MTTKKCNICGKTFDMWDDQEDFSIYRHIGYGSKYDGCKVEFDMCCDCFDRLLDTLVPQCLINPVSEVEGEML